MSIQLTPFAWVLCAMICALPVAAFVKTKYPALFVRARRTGFGAAKMRRIALYPMRIGRRELFCAVYRAVV